MAIDKSKFNDPYDGITQEGWGGTRLVDGGTNGICSMSNGMGDGGGGCIGDGGTQVIARRPIFKAPGSGSITRQPGSGN